MKKFDRTAKWIVGGLAAALAVSGLGVAAAGTSGTSSTYQAITPCRLTDTRLGPDQIGSRATPLAAAEEVVVQVHGDNGECSIPTEADAVSINVIALNPSNDSFLSIWPSDASNPGTSSLNYLAGQPPTPNFITTALSADGAITLFNQFGTVDVVIDVFGFSSDQDLDERYYTKAQVDDAFAAKADAADVYAKADVYTKSEVDDAIADIPAGGSVSTYISTAMFDCDTGGAGSCGPGTYAAPVAACDVGDHLTGGAATRVSPTGAFADQDYLSYPSGADGDAPAGWTTSNAFNIADNNRILVYAICLTTD
ncbi:MAG: hypothetical protein R8G01_10590 [Ilumatobacteraceae bacterium]|nr:hypothetical protein [Ilumatobacteraceae bacterium]